MSQILRDDKYGRAVSLGISGDGAHVLFLKAVRNQNTEPYRSHTVRLSSVYPEDSLYQNHSDTYDIETLRLIVKEWDAWELKKSTLYVNGVYQP